MKISAVEEHGLRCLMALSKAHFEQRPSTINSVAEAEGLTPQYVAKIASILRRGELVTSERGVKGGIRLARAPADITLADAIGVLEGGPAKARSCLSGVDCARHDACGLRNVWDTITRLMLGLLSRVTLADLVNPAADQGAVRFDMLRIWKEGER